MKKTIAAVVISAVAAVGSANAAIVFGNLGASGSDAIRNSGGHSLSTGIWRAIGFTTDAINLVLNSATIGLETTTAGSADIRLDLYSNNSGAPGSSLFDTSLTLAGNTAVAPVTFSLNQTLTAGTTYFIVAQQTGGSATVFWRAPVAPGASPTALNGSGWSNLRASTAQSSLNSGGSWAATGSGAAAAISLDASPIPEPGTWAAMAILAGGAAFAGWRRRQRQLA